MESTRACKNCAKNFTIDPDDVSFYEKMQVPSPTFCPKCRRIRRLLWLNDVTLFTRECKLCAKKFFSIYESGNAPEVLCPKCFFGNEFNPESYSLEYDPSIPFFGQFDRLFKSMPKLGVISDDGIGSTNCLYANDIAFSKNCILCFVAWRMENCFYCGYINGGKDMCDVHGCNEPSELIYEGVVIDAMARSKYVYWCASGTDCLFGYDLRGCTDCFMCFGLRNKRYYFKNEKYPKEEYEKIVTSYKLNTRTGIKKAQAEFTDFLRKCPRKFAELRNCTNCTGTEMIRSKNTKDGHFASFSEDSRYCNNGVAFKTCYDCSGGGETELAYECVTPDQSYNSLCTILSWKNRNVSYSIDSHSSEELFGCAGIKSGHYMILNKRYEKEDYFKLKEKIIADMKKNGEWGEFFPIQNSPFAINETWANDRLGLSREEALKAGFKWQDHLQETRGKGTLEQSLVPDAIENVTDDILEEILTCTDCSRNYKILAAEFTFYKKSHVPIPDRCFFCRMAERENMRGGFDLCSRECDCRESGHEHPESSSGQVPGKCTVVFKTCFTEKEVRPIYCEQCYLKVLD